MSSIKILQPIISSYTKDTIYDLLLQSEESSKKKDFQIEWLKSQNVILQMNLLEHKCSNKEQFYENECNKIQEKLISTCNDCFSLKKEVSFFKENHYFLKKNNDISNQDINFDKILSINKQNHDFIVVASERDAFLNTFDDSVRIQYEILEEEFLNKIKKFSINDENNDEISVWEIEDLSPRIYRELYFDQKSNTFWENKDGEITFFVNIFNKTNNEFNLIVNGDGIDGPDAIIKKINVSK